MQAPTLDRRTRPWWPPVLIAVVALARWAHAWQPSWWDDWWSEVERRQQVAAHERELVEQQQVEPERVEPIVHPYTDEARALLRGLDAGDDVGGWTVVRVEGPLDNREIRVTVARAQLEFVVSLAPTGSQAFAAPVSVAGWELFYSRVRPPHTLDDRDYMAVLQALAARIGDAPG